MPPGWKRGILMKKLSLMVLALGAVAASQAVVFEMEPNNGIASANSFGRMTPAPFADLGIGSLSAGDVDYYAVMLYAGESLNASVTQVPVVPSTLDSLLGLFDSAGNLIESDDDDGPGFVSSINRDITVTGMYYLAVSGFGDGDFNGSGHTESANYFLTVSAVPVPEPATMTALGLGIAALIRKRKQK